MTNEIIYIVGSDLETSSFYAEFDNEAKAIDFAKKNLDKLPFVQKVVTEYDDLGNENFVDYIDIWDHTMEDTAVAETEEDYWDDMMAAQFEEEEKNKYDAGDTTWFESVDTNDLVEAMEENEDMVECKECFELFPKVDGIKLDIGYICPTCADAGKLISVSDEDTFKVDFPEYEKFRDTEDEFDDSKLAMSDEDVARVNEPFEGNDEPELTPEEAVPFLVKDEEEAIAGYEKATEVIETSDVENKEEILDTLDHIKEEEEEHIEELTDLVDDEIIEVENDPISDEEEIETIEDPESAVLNEDTTSETKYWMCWYDGNDAAVVEAATEEEAEWTFMEDYKDEYFFDSWDHDWSVEEISKEEYDEWEESHSLFSPEFRAKFSLTEGAYDFEHIASIENIKAQILDQLAADARFTEYFKDGQLKITYYRRNRNAYSGYSHDETITDFEVTPSGRINITLLWSSRISSSTRKLDLETVLAEAFRNADSYALLKAIKDIATKLNKNYRPSVAVRRDKNVFETLVNNPEVTEELKNHIKRIEYRIPLLDLYPDEFIEDKSGELLTDKALNKLNEIYGNFSGLPFANDAIDANIVKNRPASEDINRNIENSWACVGNITFDCPISDLSQEAQAIISGAKLKTDADLKTDTNTTSCYRLANALIKYYSNDIFFYTKETEPVITSLTEHVNEEHPAIESDQKLKGTDNAVVDCKVAKVIAHSEDEKPVDCKGKKKPLEKPLTEGFAGKLSGEADEVDLIEFNKLCKEIGITTVSELDRFIKDESNRPGTLLDKLKSYRAELGDDFKVKDESLNEGIFSSAIKFQIRLRADDYLNNISQRLAKSLNGELVSESKRALTIEVTKTNIDSIKTVSGLTKYVDYVKSSISTAILTYNKANKSDSIDSVTLNISLSVDASLFKKGKARDAQNMSLYKCELAIPKDSTGYIDRGYTAVTISSKKFKVYDEDSKIEQVSKVLRSIFESVDGVSNSETLKETFTKEEQEEYNMDEYGVSLDGYDEYVRCTWCGEIFTKDSCVFEANLGWLCDRCYQAILSRGEKLTIIKNPTDEDIARTLTEEVKMTAKELKDKFGTDDVDLINAGREPEERVELTEDTYEIELTSDPAEKNPGENVKMANTSSTSGMDFEEACKKFGINPEDYENIEMTESVDAAEVKMPFSDLSEEEQDYIKDFTKFINDAIKNKTELTAEDILKFRDNYNK